jgi:hypothetical protein
LNEQRLVDGFMADAHGFIIREVDWKSAGDLFWAPGVRPTAVFPPSMSTSFPGHDGARNACPFRRDDDTSQPLLHITP